MPLLNFTFTFVGFAWARFINVTPRQGGASYRLASTSLAQLLSGRGLQGLMLS